MPTLPIVSLAQLAEQDDMALLQLADACQQHGFFYLVDHGLSAPLVDQCLTTAHAFFNLPAQVKEAFGHATQPGYPRTARGYVGAYGETLHAAAGPDNKQHFDWGTDRPGGAPFAGPSRLPGDAVAPGFSASALALQSQVLARLFTPLRSALARAAGCPPAVLDAHFTHPTLIQRASYYPPHHGSAGKHTDNGFLTVLIQQPDLQPSLQIHCQGQWCDVPCIDGAVLINLGDMLQYWTGGRWVSTPHQVVHCQPEPRVSLAFFIYPNIDAVIMPLGGGAGFATQTVMLNNFDSIWHRKQGAGRARELA